MDDLMTELTERDTRYVFTNTFNAAPASREKLKAYAHAKYRESLTTLSRPITFE